MVGALTWAMDQTFGKCWRDNRDAMDVYHETKVAVLRVLHSTNRLPTGYGDCGLEGWNDASVFMCGARDADDVIEVLKLAGNSR